MRLKILTSSTMTSEETERNTNSTPVERDYPQALKDAEDKPFKEDNWIHPEHWKMHSQSAELLQETADSIRGSIEELEQLKKVQEEKQNG